MTRTLLNPPNKLKPFLQIAFSQSHTDPKKRQELHAAWAQVSKSPPDECSRSCLNFWLACCWHESRAVSAQVFVDAPKSNGRYQVKMEKEEDEDEARTVSLPKDSMA